MGKEDLWASLMQEEGDVLQLKILTCVLQAGYHFAFKLTPPPSPAIPSAHAGPWLLCTCS